MLPAVVRDEFGCVRVHLRQHVRVDIEREGHRRAHKKLDPEVFTGEMLPLLQSVTLPQMRAATGSSVSLCARIRKGYVPHPRRWSRLRGVGSDS